MVINWLSKENEILIKFYFIVFAKDKGKNWLKRMPIIYHLGNFYNINLVGRVTLTTLNAASSNGLMVKYMPEILIQYLFGRSNL